MGASYVQLPADSTGKKLATRQRTVGANTVEEQYVIPISERVRSGVYAATMLCPVAASATNGTTTGFWWLYNPAASGILMALRRVEYQSQNGSALATVTSPRLSINLFTFTGGTPSGTAITPGKLDSAYPTPTGLLKSTQATTTVTLGAPVFAFLPAWSQSGSSGGPSGGTVADWNPAEEGQPVLRAGEGIVCYQPDAGTTSDTRRQIVDIAWCEYTLP